VIHACNTSGTRTHTHTNTVACSSAQGCSSHGKCATVLGNDVCQCNMGYTLDDCSASAGTAHERERVSRSTYHTHCDLSLTNSVAATDHSNGPRHAVCQGQVQGRHASLQSIGLCASAHHDECASHPTLITGPTVPDIGRGCVDIE